MCYTHCVQVGKRFHQSRQSVSRQLRPLKAMSGGAGPGCVAPAGPSRGFERYDGYERYDALHADLQQREWQTIHNLFRRAVAGEAAAQAVLNIETPQPPMPAAWLHAQLEQDTRQASLTRKSHTLPISHPHATKPHFFLIFFPPHVSQRVLDRQFPPKHGARRSTWALEMSYFGHAFRAFTWQRDYPNETVMGAIEMALSPMLGGTRVKLCAAGRAFFLVPSRERSKWR